MRVEENKRFFEDFRDEYKANKNIGIKVTTEDLVDGLLLTDEEKKEEDFFNDVAFYYVYKFSKLTFT